MQKGSLERRVLYVRTMWISHTQKKKESFSSSEFFCGSKSCLSWGETLLLIYLVCVRAESDRSSIDSVLIADIREFLRLGKSLENLQASHVCRQMS